ncbi:MAG: pilus assembly protein TadA [Deltaproteobacteria bacterium]|nr:pilus assembly protein TadA [Deltaproteobacteria bacterium]
MSQGWVYMVAGAKGGVGKSVFAHNFALALLRETRGRILLLDLDLEYCGDGSLALGIDQPTRSLADMVGLLDSLLPNMARGLAHSHESGLHFLPAYRRPEEAAALTPQVLGRCFEILGQAYDAVVADLSTGFSPANIHCLGCASRIFLVLTPDPLATAHTGRGMEILQHYAFPQQMISLILNKHDPRGEFTPDMIQARLGRPLRAVLPNDSEALARSLASRQPMLLSQPRHPFSRAMDDLAADVWSSDMAIPCPQRVQIKNAPVAPQADVSGPSAPPPDQKHRPEAPEIKAPRSSPKPLERNPLDAVKIRIHDRLLESMDLKSLEYETFQDPSKSEQIRIDTKKVVDRLLDEEGSAILDRNLRSRISQEILSEALGLGPLEVLLEDETVSEIMCNGPSQIYVERKGKLTLSEARFMTDKQLRGAIERIVAPLGRRIDELSPMVDARLKDGSRVNAVIPPLAVDGPLLTIRKFPSKSLIVDDLVAYGSFNQAIAELFKFCVQARLNILISGGTGSGKTTLLNVMSSFIPHDERIVTIEDSAELQLKQDHVCRMESRPPSLEGTGEITIRDLVRNSLRMRPDRIVVGECRGAEALDMLQAMNTGHDGSMTTIHANNPRDALNRLETLVLFAGFELPVKAIREQVASAINIIVQQSRFPDGSRKITHITELTGMEGDVITLQDIFEYRQTGVNEQGRVEGHFVASGFIPRFMTTLEAKGFTFPREIFLESYS